MKKNLLFLFFIFNLLPLRAQCDYPQIKISDDIELIKLSEKAYVHISYFEMQPFGRIGANGLLLVDAGEAFLFDSPWNDAQTETLVTYITDSLKANVSTFVPNHWHEDCLGGLDYFHQKA